MKYFFLTAFIFAAVMVGSAQSKTGGTSGIRKETIEQLTARVSKAFLARKWGGLDAGKPYMGSVILVVEHSLSDNSDRRTFTSFKQGGAWVMRQRKDTNLNASGLKQCKKGICTFNEAAGLLHNNLYLKKITYGITKGRPYIKAVYFLDGD